MGADGVGCERSPRGDTGVSTGGCRYHMWMEARVMPSFFIRLRSVLG